MDIGKEERTIRVDPITSPVPARRERPARRTIPAPTPAKSPKRSPSKVPTP